MPTSSLYFYDNLDPLPAVMDKKSIAHVMVHSGACLTPADTEAEEYQAACGAWGFSYGMSGFALSSIATLEQITAKGIPICPACLGSARSMSTEHKTQSTEQTAQCNHDFSEWRPTAQASMYPAGENWGNHEGDMELVCSKCGKTAN